MIIFEDLLWAIRDAYNTLQRDVLSRNELFDYVTGRLPKVQRQYLGLFIAAICVNNPRRSSYLFRLSIPQYNADVLVQVGGSDVKTYTYALYNRQIESNTQLSPPPHHPGTNISLGSPSPGLRCKECT